MWCGWMSFTYSSKGCYKKSIFILNIGLRSICFDCWVHWQSRVTRARLLNGPTRIVGNYLELDPDFKPWSNDVIGFRIDESIPGCRKNQYIADLIKSFQKNLISAKHLMLMVIIIQHNNDILKIKKNMSWAMPLMLIRTVILNTSYQLGWWIRWWSKYVA